MEDLQQPLQPRKKGGVRRFFLWFTFIIILVGSIVTWWNYFYVFGEGVKSGELNYVVKKGNIFKTYEGKLIQSGVRSKSPGSIQSYEFEFSVTNDSIASVLMLNSGKYFDLHYKEYKHRVAWRGYTVYIVDKIIGMKEIGH
ncbi:MAG: hypothetical protein ABIO04_02535 [Ferruginibacter sp.]